jgi:tetratricopeptide (TPR) repeat protein
MVTGQVPFEGDTPFTIGVKHKSEIPKNPKDINSQLPDDLSHVILTCLEKDKEKRYQSADEIRSELINIEKGIPTTERKAVKTKSLTSKELTVTLSMRKLFIPAMIVLALVIAAVVIWQLLAPKGAAPVLTDKPSLAVMYFVNNTGDESLDHWRSALPEWLITDLSQSKYLRVLSGDRLLNIFRKLNLMEAKSYDSRDLENVVREGAVNHILKASFSKAGDTFRIDYSLQDANSWESVGSDYVSGKGEESFPSMVDELTRKIKADINISADKIADDFDKGVETITTSSPEAYKLYMEGSNYHRMGEFRKAIESWEKAVALDPEFSTAYRSMAIAYTNMGYSSKANELLKKALDLSDRVSDQEKYRIQAEYYGSTENTWDKAIEAFKKLLTHYPDDSAGNTNLGMLYAQMEEWDKAIAQTDVNIRSKEETFYSYWVQGWAYMGKGMHDRSKEILNYFLDNYADHPFIRNLLASNYLALGDYSLALAEVEKSFMNSQDYYYLILKGTIFLCKGDLVSSETEMKKLLEMDDKIAHGMGWYGLAALKIYEGRFNEAKKNIWNAIKVAEEIPQPEEETLNRIILIGLHLRSGDIDEALRECETAWNSSVQQGSYSGQIAASFYKGMIHVEEENFENAEVEAEKIKNLVDQWINKKLIRYYYHLKGLIELKKENYPVSIENFSNALSFMSGQSYFPDDHALFLEPLAYVYFMMSDLEKAEEVFNKIISLETGRFNYGDIYTKSFYMLGKIYEQKGWAGKAIENYEKFLELWKDADPIFPEIEDAKDRLTALKK